MQLRTELAVAKEAAHAAGEKIMELYKSEDIQVDMKEGNSPVTLADTRANGEICKRLHTAFPDYGIISEEEITEASLPNSFLNAMLKEKACEYTWIIDPLDGTREFINHTDDFGVHIGLTHQGTPVLGVNYYPVSETYYFGVHHQGAYKQTKDSTNALCVSEKDSLEEMTLVMNKFKPHTSLKKILADLNVKDVVIIGSLGLKICNVAEGVADLHSISVRTQCQIWDSCSPQVILEEAGGKLTDLYGQPIAYDAESTTRLTKGMFASNGKQHDRILEVLQKYFL
jgi:3'(2'), 5'-bisphosphate nucleotidase